MNRKEVAVHIIALPLLFIWMLVVIPSLIMPLDMTLFEKVVISTMGALGGFAAYGGFLVYTIFTSAFDQTKKD